MAGLRGRFEALASWWRATRVARAQARFGAAGGGLLTGGIAYTALFSAFAALTLGWTVFVTVLGGNDELRARVLDSVASTLPGLVTSDDGAGLLEPDQLRLTAGWSVAGAVAVVTLLVSAVSAASALRKAVRAMFAADDRPNLLVGKVRELGGLLGIAAAVLVSALLTLGTTTAADWLLGALGWGSAYAAATRVVGVLVALLVDAATFVLVVRVLAGVNPPRRDLLSGALLTAVGLAALRLLGTSVVTGSVRGNPALAPFAAVVVLLAWVNLMARIVLLAAAWTANPPPTAPPAAVTPAEMGTSKRDGH